jgi:bifunctional non-homologous end joining protein LigD
LLWDLGMWKPCSGYSHVDECLRNGTLKFTLYGAKLKGDWTLVRIQGRRSGPGTVWLLTKEPDVFARSKEARSILEEAPNSVSTGRTLEQIRRDGDTTKKREPEPTLF